MSSARFPDAQIAAEASRRLDWDTAVPAHAVRVSVAQGRLTLSGELQREQQRAAMLEDVTRLFGVSGVTDRTVIKTG
ncbi:transporter [Burkholderia sp. SRS-W-2-2016]|uniref:BON domain-containing protein n=1 Tax=Burkholderia sp. SRS-W-2-2016 TaxID=1926878 RepID=UPI00094B2992|nr:BON domain-containing protein [Burkholderia sp. SRS-W-2-2016]OLL28413.1 transporter [Burkholderia sp. SRS-W-2-2016]